MINQQLALVRREIWEHRSIWVTPAAVAAVVTLLAIAMVVAIGAFGEAMNADIAKLEEAGEIPEDLAGLRDWWAKDGEPNAEDDKPKVKESQIFGGQQALIKTATVPAIMFVGYLLLVLYFRSKGGYTVVELDDKGKPNE